jgi:hypothetical protein
LEVQASNARRQTGHGTDRGSSNVPPLLSEPKSPLGFYNYR